MTKTNAYAFDCNLSGLENALCSLQSCHAEERAREARSVARWYATCAGMVAARRNHEREDHRARLLARADEALARHGMTDLIQSATPID